MESCIISKFNLNSDLTLLVSTMQLFSKFFLSFHIVSLSSGTVLKFFLNKDLIIIIIIQKYF